MTGSLDAISGVTDAATRDEAVAALRAIVPEMRDPRDDLPPPEAPSPRPQDTVH